MIYGCFPVSAPTHALGLAVVSGVGVRCEVRCLSVCDSFSKERDNCSDLTLQSC